MITHASSSEVNPVIWKDVVKYLMSYFKRSPLESQVFIPSLVLYKNKNLYKVTTTLHCSANLTYSHPSTSEGRYL